MTETVKDSPEAMAVWVTYVSCSFLFVNDFVSSQAELIQ
jgi:hypothetical protein